VLADLPSQSALVIGLVTKGFGAGGTIEVQIGINLAGTSQCGGNPCNGLVLACNTGAACPPPPASSDHGLDLVTDANSYTRIAIPDNADCTGPVHRSIVARARALASDRAVLRSSSL